MILLNLGCGGDKLPEPFINVDMLKSHFTEGTPERAQIDALPNYVESDLSKRLPFEDASVDGCFLSHVIEHFDAQRGLALLKECHRVMKPGAHIMASVPDASYFRSINEEDINSNWPRLFEVSDPNNPIPSFFEAALWFNEHFAILTEDALWCYFKRAGFRDAQRIIGTPVHTEALRLMGERLNRRIFSLEMFAAKP